jgi:carboxypeptidase PM20D1
MRDGGFRHGRWQSRGRRRRRMLRRVVVIGSGVVLLLGTIVGIRTATFRSRQAHASPAAIAAATHEPADVRAMAEHLGQAVRFQTVSFQDPARSDLEAFRGMHRFLEATYPRLHATLKREVVGEFSLLYTWEGADRSLPPIVLLAHQDVVPVESPGAWKHDPFGGEVTDGAVWGRGSVDCKGSLIGSMEAVESLVTAGFRPKRTVMLAFGHDEEVGGRRGARAIAALLDRRGVRPEFILDEGGAITAGIVRGIDRPVAAVGIAEKGYVTLELRATTEGGHASMPPAHTAAGVLAAAIERLEDNPFPASFNDVTRETFDYLGPEMPFTRRMALANRWLFGPLVRRQLLASPATAAMLRTTSAVTMLRSGIKENVLPAEASAVVNLRIIPGETSESVIERVREIIADPRVQVRPLRDAPITEPSAVSDPASPGFQLVQQALAEVTPDAVVAPTLVLGGTDSHHYAGLTPTILRFIPAHMTADDLKMIHGDNERLTLDDCGLMVRFYLRLIRNAAGR